MTDTDKLIAAAYAASNQRWEEFISRYQDALTRIGELRKAEGRERAEGIIAALDKANRS